jgi:hypothetical protein
MLECSGMPCTVLLQGHCILSQQQSAVWSCEQQGTLSIAFCTINWQAAHMSHSACDVAGMIVNQGTLSQASEPAGTGQPDQVVA